MAAHRPTDFSFTVSFGRGTTVHLGGELDLLHAPTLTATLETLVDRGHIELAIDGTDLDFIDLSGLDALHTAHRRATRLGGAVRVHGLSETAHRMLELSGIGDVLPAERRTTDRLTTRLSRLATELTGREMATILVEQLTDLIPRIVGGAAGAGVTLRREDRFLTAAASDEIVRHLDDLQNRDREGPCIDTATRGIQNHVDITDGGRRWPRFRNEANGVGVRDVLSSPLDVAGRPVGALNLYSRSAGFFSSRQRNRATALAGFLSTLLDDSEETPTRHRELEIRDALRRRDAISRAEGILMARDGLGIDEAREVLRRRSIETSVPLHRLAIETPPATDPDRVDV